MNFKKIIAAAASLAICGAMLTACGTSNNTAETETSAETTTVSETTTISETESETEASEETVPTESETEAETEAEAVSENPLKPAVDAAINAVGQENLPFLEEMNMPEFLKEFYLIDPENENFENIIVYYCPMSAVMTEIIIIEAKDGQVDAAKETLEARKKKAMEQDAFYPADVENAEASIVGTQGNYAYFLLSSAAADMETALKDALNAL